MRLLGPDLAQLALRGDVVGGAVDPGDRPFRVAGRDSDDVPRAARAAGQYHLERIFLPRAGGEHAHDALPDPLAVFRAGISADVGEPGDAIGRIALVHVVEMRRPAQLAGGGIEAPIAHRAAPLRLLQATIYRGPRGDLVLAPGDPDDQRPGRAENGQGEQDRRAEIGSFARRERRHDAADGVAAGRVARITRRAAMAEDARCTVERARCDEGAIALRDPHLVPARARDHVAPTSHIYTTPRPRDKA